METTIINLASQPKVSAPFCVDGFRHPTDFRAGSLYSCEVSSPTSLYLAERLRVASVTRAEACELCVLLAGAATVIALAVMR